MAADYTDIATKYRQIYRAKFREELSAGTKKPFLLPYYVLGGWLIPTLYLAIPHKNRPWLYRARWLVLVVVVLFNLNLIRNHSSLNFAAAYCAGLLPAFSTLWTFALLVWTKPQWDAKRVEVRRKRKKDTETTISSSDTQEKGHTSRTTGNEGQSSLDGASPASNGNGSKEDFEERPNLTQSSGIEVIGTAIDGGSHGGVRDRRVHEKPASPTTYSRVLQEKMASLMQRGNNEPLDPQLAVDLRKLAAEQEFEYYWQEYPADASIWTRLDWAFDIVTTFRLTGWNWAIPCLPPYEPPPKIGDYQLPLSYTRHESKQGFTRTVSRKELLLSRLLINIIPSYLIVDLVAVHMTADPYFVLGPSDEEPLPAHLAGLHPLALSAWRTALSFAGMLSALQLMFNLGALALAFAPPPLSQLLGLRAHPWHLPSFSGSFAQVLDRGLPGFWGAWWHQTFRFAFEAPTRFWLRRHHHARAPVIAAAVAFLQSGFLHAASSYATVPAHTHWWSPPLFFALSGAGALLQSWLARQITSRLCLPRWARRLGNLAFAVAWLWATSWPLLDDLGRCGLWLYEPVPVSPARALGIGPSEDRRVWRYESDDLPRLWVGRRWWEIGIGM
ncbi:hypothetical protein F4779DRAFT_399214 [Xylariaceae sp. FL0662B]|nr:hypothetical protein F4779DRAFT_399214 [Xylariaceae sp. FL0662B]